MTAGASKAASKREVLYRQIDWPNREHNIATWNVKEEHDGIVVTINRCRVTDRLTGATAVGENRSYLVALAIGMDQVRAQARAYRRLGVNAFGRETERIT